jgi:hypothetical protein
MNLRESKDFGLQLRRSIAQDRLARELYACRCEFHKTAQLPWEDVHPGLRRGFRDLAAHFLTNLPEDCDACLEALTELNVDMAKVRHLRLVAPIHDGRAQ